MVLVYSTPFSDEEDDHQLTKALGLLAASASAMPLWCVDLRGVCDCMRNIFNVIPICNGT